MATAGPKQVILETSVLINFLKVDRVDVLARLPGQEFLITDPATFAPPAAIILR